MNRQHGRMWAVLAGAMVVCGLMQSAQATQEYRFVDLGTGPVGFESAAAYTGSGEQQFGLGCPVGGNASSLQAVMWSGTPESAVNITPSGFTCARVDASGDGQQVGLGQVPVAYYPYSQTHAVLWTGTAQSAVDLNPVGFDYTVASGVQGGRQVGGGLGPATSGAGHALMWSGTSAAFTDLHPVGYVGSFAAGICGNNQVGQVTTSVGGYAALWHGTPESAINLNPSWAVQSYANNTSLDEQVGAAWTSSGERHAVLWRGNAESAVDLNPAGFDDSEAEAVAGGMQVGSGYTQEGARHALAWFGSSESVLDLQQFVPAQYASFDSYAFGMDEQGRIMGAAGGAHACMWVPVPEPVSGVMLALGGIVLLRKRPACVKRFTST